MLVVLSLVVGIACPAIIQRFQVDPSAITLQADYIERNIQATRDAYGVSDVNVEPTNTQTETEAGQLAEDAQTTANLRIMDPALVSGAFQHLQSFRQYYSFLSSSTSTATRSTERSSTPSSPFASSTSTSSATKSRGSTSTRSTPTDTASSPPTETSAVLRASPCSCRAESRLPAIWASTSLASTSASRLPRVLDRRRSRRRRRPRARLPPQRGGGGWQRHDDLLRRRRTEPRRPVQPPRVRAAVPE